MRNKSIFINLYNRKNQNLSKTHGPIHLRSIEVIADALAEAVQLGLLKTVGVSNYSTGEMIEMYDCLQKHGIQLASNQVEFSILRRLPETRDVQGYPTLQGRVESGYVCGGVEYNMVAVKIQ